MTKEKKKMTDQEIENAVDAAAEKNYELGKVSAAEELPKRLQVMAGEAFLRKQDGYAKALRALSDMFHTEAKQKRTAFMATYHPEMKQ